MHTGFVMVPQMIQSQSTSIVLAEEETKKLPMIINEISTSLTVI